MCKKLTWGGLLVVFLLFSPLCAFAESMTIVEFGDDITITEDQAVKHIVSVGGQVTVYGKVEGRIWAIGSSVVLSPTAHVERGIITVGGIIVLGTGSRVEGPLMEINASNFTDVLGHVLTGDWEGWSWVFAFMSIAFYLSLLLAAILLSALIPRSIMVISMSIQTSPYLSVFWGLLAVILAVPLAALLVISVIGVTLIPLELALLFAASLVGFVAASRLTGHYIFRFCKRPDQTCMKETIVGLTCLWFVGWMPYLGGIVKVLALILGLGGVLMTRFGTYRKQVVS
jgi:hypothetical protein